MHEILLNGYRCTAVDTGRNRLNLGTYGSYGLERLHITLGEGWEDMTVTATFHPPGQPPVKVILDSSGIIDVPPEATAVPAPEYSPGILVFSGNRDRDGVQRISTNLLFIVEDHAQVDGVDPGPSESEYAQLIGMYQSKLDKQQGKNFAGMVLGIGNDGYIMPVEAPAARLAITENLRYTADGKLDVNTVPAVLQDNTRPITSAAVYAEVGNIEVLLSII